MIYTVTLNPAIDKEVQVDNLEFNHVLRAKNEHIDFGGKGFNISRFLKQFDIQNISLGFIGGNAGSILDKGLHGLNIKTDFIHIKGETRTNISYLDHNSSRYIKVNEPGPKITSEEQDQLIHKIDSLTVEGDWWVLAGSLPRGIASDFYAKLIKKINAKGAKTILDTSGDAFHQGCLAKPFLIKPNEIEAEQLLNRKITDSINQYSKAAQDIQKQNITNVVLSLGDRGAILATETSVFYAESIKIDEGNPIGAGDSMVAGMLISLSQNKQMKEAFAFGIACGTATATMPGTQLGNSEQVNDILQKVKIKKIK